MEQSEMAAMGGRARWKKVGKKKRSEMMRNVANKRYNKEEKLSTPARIDKQARRV